MEKLPNFVRDRLQSGRATDHLEPNLLNAFAEQSLQARERSVVLEHLAGCSECRGVLALAAPELQPVAATPSPFKSLVRDSGFHWLQWPVLRWASLAACVLVVGTAATMWRTQHHNSSLMEPSLAARSDSYSPPLKHAESLPTGPAAAEASRVNPIPESKKKESFPAGAVTFEASSEEKRGPALAANGARDKGLSASLKNENRQATPAPSAPPVASAVQAQVADQNSPALASSAPGAATPVPVEQLSKGEAAPAAQGKLDQLRDEKAANDKQAAKDTVDVDTGTVLVETQPQSLPATAMGSAAKFQTKSRSGNTAGRVSSEQDKGLSQQNLAERAAIAPGASIMKDLVNARWSLSSDGLPQRSLDAGKTWEKMHVENLSGFRALSAAGLEVWVGGLGGLLYHTNDVGMHWTRVKPTVEGTPLTADIVRIDFSDALRGKVTTADQHTWSTLDGGKTWQKN